jgi:hypothetical protein
MATKSSKRHNKEEKAEKESAAAFSHFAHRLPIRVGWCFLWPLLSPASLQLNDRARIGSSVG